MSLKVKMTRDEFNQLGDSVLASDIYKENEQGELVLNISPSETQQLPQNQSLYEALKTERGSVKAYKQKLKEMENRLSEMELLSNHSTKSNEDNQPQQDFTQFNKRLEALQNEVSMKDKELETLRNQINRNRVDSVLKAELHKAKVKPEYVDMILTAEGQKFQDVNGVTMYHENEVPTMSVSDFIKMHTSEKPDLYLQENVGINPPNKSSPKNISLEDYQYINDNWEAIANGEIKLGT